MTPMPTYFISHGGGPWPWMPDMQQAFAPLATSLAALPSELPAPPRAILMVSGHWETPEVSVMTSPRPPMLYDYYNFPAHTYQISYPAPGAPDLAARAAALIAAAGLPVARDNARGFDHGAFVPMAVSYPAADVPMFQVSIRENYDPAQHFALGRALAPLRDDGVLIVGSGLSYHNLRLFGPNAKQPSEQFDAWLNTTMAQPPSDRTAALLNWETAPSARVCHEREDHLVPLFVALGAAEDAPATQVYHQTMILGGVTASSFRLG